MTNTPPVCDYEGSDYQTTFWDQGGRAYEDQAEAIALRRILPTSGRLLLELGAGAGRNTPRYAGYARIVLLEQNYVHLTFKQAMHAVSPLQRLRLLRHRLEELRLDMLPPEIEFHNEMTRVFNSLRDLHTTYRLPYPFRDKIAWLPFIVEEFWGGVHRRVLEGFREGLSLEVSTLGDDIGVLGAAVLAMKGLG